jgi:hypothetical protein
VRIPCLARSSYTGAEFATVAPSASSKMLNANLFPSGKDRSVIASNFTFLFVPRRASTQSLHCGARARIDLTIRRTDWQYDQAVTTRQPWACTRPASDRRGNACRTAVPR